MANTNVTRVGTLAQKKVVRVHSTHVGPAFIAEAIKLGAAAGVTGNYLVANLPRDAVITDAYVVVDEASNAATTATVALGTAEGGAQIMAAADVKTTGVKGTLVGKLKTGTGQPVYMALAYTGATTNYGSFTVVIEYTEFRKNSGEYTEF